MLKNDEEPARHEGGEAMPSKEMLPDKSVGDTLENTFIFLLLEKKMHLLSLFPALSSQIL